MTEENSDLDSLLSGMSRKQLEGFRQRMGERKQFLMESIETLQTQLYTPVSIPGATPKPNIQVDPKKVRREVYSTIHSLDRMRSSEAYWARWRSGRWDTTNTRSGLDIDRSG